MPIGTYRCNVVLKSGVIIRGVTQHHQLAGKTVSVKFSAVRPGPVIDTSAEARTYSCGVIGVQFQGLGQRGASSGVVFRNVSRSFVRWSTFNDFSDEAVRTGPQSIACLFEDILIQNTLMNRGHRSRIGAFDLHGTDHFCSRIEATTSQSIEAEISSTRLNLCAIMVRSANNMFSDCVGEISDIGIYLTAAAKFNRFSNCRVDLNYGPGFLLEGTSNVLAACVALKNSQGLHAGYSGFLNAVRGNSFAACWSGGHGLDRRKQAFGFEDGTVKSTDDAKNYYAACNGDNNARGLFSYKTG